MTNDNIDDVARKTGRNKAHLVKALILFSYEGRRAVKIPVTNFGPWGLRSYTKDELR